MKTVVLYASRHGSAGKCAAKIAGKSAGETTVLNLKNAGPIDLADYDAVIIGGSIRAGRIQKNVKRFCEKNLKALKGKRLGLFLCCMAEGAKAEEQFAQAFPGELIAAAAAKGLFGGEFDFDKMNWLEKAVIKKISGVTASVSKLKDEAIDSFVRAMSGPGR